jgi:hypothetical protein
VSTPVRKIEIKPNKLRLCRLVAWENHARVEVWMDPVDKVAGASVVNPARISPSEESDMDSGYGGALYVLLNLI